MSQQAARAEARRTMDAVKRRQSFARDLEAERARLNAQAHPADADGDTPHGPAAVLAGARIDLVDLARNGIPPRDWLPGSRLLIRGKRYLLVGAAGTGKSLAALVIAVEAVTAGAAVAIIDVENGADEYARRLEHITAGHAPTEQACEARLYYYAWPALSLAWTESAWAAALEPAELVIFDSSRLALSSVGLAEDKADDYARFANAFLLPLARAGTTTLMLDNTGHEAQDRARGTKAKDDLNEVVYALKVTKAFSADTTGRLELKRTRTRFSDAPQRLAMTIGGSTYQAPEPVEPDPDAEDKDWRPTHLMEKASKIIEDKPGLTRNAILARLGGKKDYAVAALEELVVGGHARIEDGANNAHCYHPVKPYREVA